MTKKFAVLGHPITHSLSPRIHQHFANQFGIKINYQAIDVDINNFSKKLSDLKDKGYEGLNITLPLKNLAYEVCDQLSLKSQKTKSVNTISILNGKIYGDTTDGMGLVKDLLTRGVGLKDKKILIIGAGGASNGVMYDLIAQHPYSIFLTNRTISKSHQMMVDWMGFAMEKKVVIDILESNERLPFDLIINATSSSLGSENVVLPNNLNGQFWYDMMYGKQTTFLSMAEKNKAEFCDGLGMLVEQAAAAFNIWHKVKPDTKTIYHIL
tara:strand:- start:199 stop:999 length:801 start_codon:yes stop_codon:yes gene_type:complete